MYPVLFSIGPLTVYFFSLFVILAWLTFSFLFWRTLKDEGIDDDKIFNLTFYATIVGLILSRLIYVAWNWSQFSDAPLKIAALWITPGFSFFGLISGLVIVIVASVRIWKIKAQLLFDAVMYALPFAHAAGSIGVLLDGSVAGKASGLPWAIIYAGSDIKRHPVALYFILADILIISCYLFVKYLSRKRHRLPDFAAIYSLLLLTVLFFGVEFFREQTLYWAGLSVSQWVLLAVFSETAGVVFIQSGGREKFVRTNQRLRSFLARILHKGYGFITQKISRRNQKPA